MVNVIVIENNIVKENYLCNNSSEAEYEFKQLCKKYIEDFGKYTKDEIDEILDNGYIEDNAHYKSVNINWPEVLF